MDFVLRRQQQVEYTVVAIGMYDNDCASRWRVGHEIRMWNLDRSAIRHADCKRPKGNLVQDSLKALGGHSAFLSDGNGSAIHDLRISYAIEFRKSRAGCNLLAVAFEQPPSRRERLAIL